MENYTRVGTPVQVFSEKKGFIPGQISLVESARVDVIALTPSGVKHFKKISHADFYHQGDKGWFWQFVPQNNCYAENIKI